MIIEVIPFKSFKERINLVKNIRRNNKSAIIEIYPNYLYVETKGEMK